MNVITYFNTNLNHIGNSLAANSLLNGSTAALSEVTDACPIGAYSGSAAFVTGAIAQVAFVFKRLGGDVLDVEITSGSVYAAYEESCLE